METNTMTPVPLQPRFVVGPDSHGCWIVRDRLRRVGGLFATSDAARHFAYEEANHDGSQIDVVSDTVELGLTHLRSAGHVH